MNEIITQPSGDNVCHKRLAAPLTEALIRNIITRNKKGKDVMEIEWPSVVTHIVDEVEGSTFTISIGY